ncbi:hypothetical protein tb265_02150 [Gemmatimonadetes bacterium T265]|nr:hypothetical protein tb265_02150 [Gemmatimonadetes bacterium T265]
MFNAACSDDANLTAAQSRAPTRNVSPAQSLPGAAAADQSATDLAASFPFCAWWTETTATSLNVAFPDASAAYWTTPLLATPDLVSVTASGEYADARYFSLNAYNNGAASYDCASTPSALADYVIAPDAGSENPFQTSAPVGGRYTVTLARAGAQAPARNTIPLYQYPGCQPAPSQGVLPSTLTFLILRAYLPHGGFAQVPLADLTLHYTDGRRVVLPHCGGTTPALAGVGAEPTPGWVDALRQRLAVGDATGVRTPGVQRFGRPGATASPPALTFFRPSDSGTGGFFPNVDNKYVAALVQPKPETVVVIRAKAPTFPPGMHAAPWDPRTVNLRYWSMCSNVYRRPYPVVVVKEGGQTIPGCAPDLATKQDGRGYYTYVVSHVRGKPSDAALAANNATWLPFSTAQPYAQHLMILRNMLGADFPHSVQNCAAGSDPASIAACRASMGDYYPRAAECRTRTFETGGTAACVQEYQRAPARLAGAT